MRLAILYSRLTEKRGAQNMIIWMAEELTRRGHEVTIFTTRYTSAFWADRPGGQQYRVRELLVRGLPRFLEAIYPALALRKEIGTFDIVNPHDFPSYVWVYLAAKLGASIRKSVWFCEEPPRTIHYRQTTPHKPVRRDYLREIAYALFGAIVGPLEKRAGRFYDIVIANSEYTASFVRSIYGTEVRACWLGIPVPSAPPKKYGPSEEYSIFVATTLAPLKNNDTLLRAMRVVVRDKNTPVRLRIAGVGRDEERLKRMAADLGIVDRVEFLGRITDPALLTRLYAEADIAVYLPLNEPFGLVPVEAMMVGTPVVGSNEGGVRESIVDQKTGILVDPENPEEVADAIAGLLNDNEKRKKMGEAGREWARATFSIQAFMDRFLENCAG